MFQFHYGTIGRLRRSFILFNCTGMFQFHYGTIGREITYDAKGLVLSFQFHYGTIGSQKANYNRTSSTVSIPLWYDW